MAGMAKVRAVAYRIAGGMTKVRAVVYRITGGMTKVRAVAYRIAFAQTHTVTITGSGKYNVLHVEFPISGLIPIYMARTLEVENETQITALVNTSATPEAARGIYYNGVLQTRDGSFVFTVTSDVTVQMKLEYSDGTTTPSLAEMYITTT